MHGGLEPSWNEDLLQTTLNPQPVFPELYYPLWWYSGSYNSGANAAWSGLAKGSTGTTTINTTDTPCELFTLNPNWPSTQMYSLEITMWTTNSSYTATASLWDVTSNTQVTSSVISSSSTTANVYRSSKFTLTSGHTYAVAVKAVNGSNTAYFTDTSLIIFPQAPLTSLSVFGISLANPSGNTLKEAYIPLWCMSSGTASTPAGQSGDLLAKGNTTTNSMTGNTFLHRLSSGWSANQKFVFEASIYIANSSYSAIASIYDISTSSNIIASQVSTTSTTSTLLRSGAFTLTSGHFYGVLLTNSNYNGIAYLSKAHLVALAP